MMVQEEPIMLTLDESANGQEVELAVGQELEVCLRENPTTGYRWRLDAEGAPACRLIEDFARIPNDPPGRGGTHHWHFQGVQAGDAAIELASRRSWEARTIGTFLLRVRVVP
jgi:inhibitor of cysteine peptidase